MGCTGYDLSAIGALERQFCFKRYSDGTGGCVLDL